MPESYTYNPVPLPETFEEYYQHKLSLSQKLNVRPGNEELLIRFSETKTPFAILYIHGFGACRAEGEYTVEKIAHRFRANSYCLRLPGHGTNKEDHGSTTYPELLDESITALMMMEKLGDKVIIMGVSMGGLISTWLASQYPEKIEAVLLCSPFYTFASTVLRSLFNDSWFKVVTSLKRTRTLLETIPSEEDNWSKYWYRQQYLHSLKLPIGLAKLIAHEAVYKKISIPVLVYYYYKTEWDQDKTASAAHMKEAFSLFGMDSTPHPLNKLVQISSGSHVLTSKYYPSDKETILKEMTGFLNRVIRINYHGIIVKQSQVDKSVFKKLKIIGKRRIWPGLFTLYKVEVSEENLDEVIKIVQRNMKKKSLFHFKKFYIYFYRNDELIVVFKDRVFSVSTDDGTWDDVVQYGKSIDISLKQLDFFPNRFEDESF
ncbi:MAG: alpha/beta hydrolase [bacterium]|nr:alpha/beta hydrolase [bacterium]